VIAEVQTKTGIRWLWYEEFVPGVAILGLGAHIPVESGVVRADAVRGRSRAVRHTHDAGAYEESGCGPVVRVALGPTTEDDGSDDCRARDECSDSDGPRSPGPGSAPHGVGIDAGPERTGTLRNAGNPAASWECRSNRSKFVRRAVCSSFGSTRFVTLVDHCGRK
jgi:hypothetical protein